MLGIRPILAPSTPASGPTPAPAPADASAPQDRVTLSASAPAPPQPTSSAPATPPQSKTVNPFPIIKGITDYCHNVHFSQEEAPEQHGVVYEQRLDGSIVDLEAPGQTTPDIPAAGPDIPAEAVKDNRVVIYVDGIHQDRGTQQDQIHRLLQAPPTHPDHGASVEQPVIGIHEGVGRTFAADLGRITMDWLYLKGVQTHGVPVDWLRDKIYLFDPVVKSVHDEIRQSLEAGRDVQLVAHSGGGQETALALNMISREEHGRFKDAIRDHVRVLALAPAAAPQDYEAAGVKPENLLYTGSRQDPLWNFAHHFIHPVCVPCNLPAVAAGLKTLWMLTHFNGLPYHSPDYIFWQNLQPNGSSRINDFLAGAPGGNYPLP